MKKFSQFFLAFLGFSSWVVGFVKLMNMAIIDPVELNAANPVYSWWRIGAWILYICLSGAGWVWLRSEGPLQ